MVITETPYTDAVRTQGGVRAAARALGYDYSKFYRRLKAEERLLAKISAKTSPITTQISSQFRQISPPPQPDKQADIIKFVYFTDAHNQPGLEMDRFVWLANLVNEEKPHYLIDGGDFDDLNSLCRHERNESWKGRFKPSFAADLEAAAEARALLDKHMTVLVTKHVTLGNHEARLWEFENANPEVYGMMQHAYLDIFKRYDWHVTLYRDYLTLHGIDFTHIPQSGMNKPVGGNNPCNIISRDSIRDVCFGHTHAIGLQVAHKLGPSRSVKAFNGGCYMPQGYVPSYSVGSRKEFWYGAHVLESINGRLNVVQSIPMDKMQRIYGG